jgi:membrane protein DedA with SNARE-associated domain
MSLEDILTTYGYPALFLGTLFEGETPLIIASFLAHRGYLKLSWVIIVAFSGTLIADQFFFYLGKRKGPALLKRKAKWQANVERVNKLLGKHQRVLVLGFRFLYGLRTLTPFMIGMSSFNKKRFLLLNTIGAIIWTVSFTYAGYSIGQVIEVLLDDIKRVEHWVVGGIVVTSIIIWIWHTYSRSKKTPDREAQNKEQQPP